MKTWVVAMLVTLGASSAHAKEVLDISKALSVSEHEKQIADDASRKKVREVSRRTASEPNEKIVINLSNLEN